MSLIKSARSKKTSAVLSAIDVLEPRLFLAADPLILQHTNNILASGGAGAFATVGNLALFVGGEFGSFIDSNFTPYFASASPQASDVVDIYNAATGQWSVTRLPHARTASTAVAVGHKVVVAGGTLGDTETPVNPIDIYDAIAGSWSSATAAVPGPFDAVAAVGNQAILVPSTPGSAPVQLLDATTDTFTSHSLASGAHVNVVVVGAKAYFFEEQGTIEIYDSTNGQWTSDSVANDADFTGETAVVDSKIVFAGGNPSFQTRMSAGGVFDIASGQWTPHTALLDAHSSVTVVGHKVIFAGGATSSFFPSDHIAIYDASTDQWSSATLSEARTDIVAFTKGHTAFFIGGTDGGYGDPSNASDVYDDQTGTWSTFTLRHPVARQFGHPSTPLIDGQLIVPDFDLVDVFIPSTLAPPSRPGITPRAGLRRSPAYLTWDASPGAIRWDVYLDDVLVAHTQTNVWKVERTLTQGYHSWQIVAHDATQFTASQRWTFTVRPPAPVTQPGIPTGARLSQSPKQLTWAPSAGALRYDVYLDGVHFLRTAGTVATLDNAVGGGKHVWSVVAGNNLSRTPTAAWTFTTPTAPVIHATAPFRMPVPAYQYEPVAVDGKILYSTDDATNPFGTDLFVYDSISGTEQSAPFPDYFNFPGYISGDNALAQPAVIGSQVIYRDANNADVYDAAKKQFLSYHYFDTPRQYPTVAVIGDQAVYAGGTEGNGNSTIGNSDAVDIYNAHTHRWYTAKLSVARGSMASAVVGSKLLLAGGSYQGATNQVESNAVDIFDPSTGQWTSTTLSIARSVGGVASAGNLVFFAGGQSGPVDAQFNVPLTDAVDIYDASTGQWSTAHLSSARNQITTLTVGHFVLFAGGVTSDNSSNASDVVDIYDTQSNQWSVAHLSSPLGPSLNRSYATAVLDNLGFILNGDHVEIFNASTGQFSSVALQGGGGEILIVGRKVLIGGATSALDVYDADNGRWTVAALSLLNDQYRGVVTGNKAVFLATQSNGESSSLNRSILDIFGDPLAVSSLTASVDQSTLHGTVRAGDKGSAIVSIRNNGQVPLAAPLTVTVYASPTISVGSGAVMLGSVTLGRQSLSPGQSIQVPVPLIAPARLANLNYFITAAVHGGSESTLNVSPARQKLRLDTSSPHGASFG